NAKAEAARHAALAKEKAALARQSDGLLARVLEAGSASVIKACEARSAKRERHDRGKARTQPAAAQAFEDLFERALGFLKKPCDPWASRHLTLKRTVLGPAFAEQLAYCRKSGLRTPKQPCGSGSWMGSRA